MRFVILQICFLCSLLLFSQEGYKLMFYNVENYFDVVDDSLTVDGEFTPEGYKHWTARRMRTKKIRVAKTILAAGQGSIPVLVGLAEVENADIGKELTQYSPLRDSHYDFLHHESSDRRGIDVMLLYRKDIYHPVSTQFLRVKYPANPNYRTREILYSKGVLAEDTLHVFVNHWPSKYGGAMASEPKRIAAAKTLRSCVDSLLSQDAKAKVIIMGDMNATADEAPVKDYLKTCEYSKFMPDSCLVNLSWTHVRKSKGSYKYKGKWNVIDHMIVSQSLLRLKGLHTDSIGMQIISPPFLLEEDKQFLGQKPKRTYIGPRYNDGFSDHLPVVLDLYK